MHLLAMPYHTNLVILVVILTLYIAKEKCGKCCRSILYMNGSNTPKQRQLHNHKCFTQKQNYYLTKP